MDCPSEEQIIRMKLEEEPDIKSLSFDLATRYLTVVHEGEVNQILSLLTPLNFGEELKESLPYVGPLPSVTAEAEETTVLKSLLWINAVMFVVEVIIGLYADSIGLISDGIDMLADALVYGVSLYAIGKTAIAKRQAAKLSGVLQLFLAVVICVESVRRFIYGSEPMSSYMISISLIALLANVACLVLISKFRDGEVHMKASWIFSANDVVANLGVILAGVLVMLMNSRLPDLIIGIVVSLVVGRGAWTILKIAR